MRKSFGGMILAIGLLALSGPAWANSSDGLQSPAIAGAKTFSSAAARMMAPRQRTATCYPTHGSCGSANDCCSGSCDPKLWSCR